MDTQPPRRVGYGRRSGTRRLVFYALTAVLLFIALFAWLLLGRDHAVPETERGDLASRLSTPQGFMHSGTVYTQRRGLTSILFLGLESGVEGDEQIPGAISNLRANFLLLLVIDEPSQKLELLYIDRDTMADIPLPDAPDGSATSRRARISLSTAFATSSPEGCALAARTVSGLLAGATIDNYYALDMKAISELNSYLGGLNVVIRETFSGKGEGAEVVEGVAAENPDRQARYLPAMMMLSSKAQTNLHRGRLINLANISRGYRRESILRMQGMRVTGSDGDSEFHPDADHLLEISLKLFYEPSNAGP